ncbi:c-type cytochrome [Mangrovimicrobium sediminis]|uniref:C-type cytochrome n=1 Tax=Mangrovimicrobium sediminis TaxID=2562682 RepID=A0A4Z0LY43_9GAMM|nr:c-type cytochrome [Haliea sp. SAOS-164]TGD72068.1 c-type cytochrome [Haliea sp. SAOS-164]
MSGVSGWRGNNSVSLSAIARAACATVVLALTSLCTAAAHADELDNRLTLASTERGRVVFGPCRVCHAIQSAPGTHTGPDLSGIFGRVVGSREDYDGYSAAFRQARFVWTPRVMFAWLENPMGMYPASSMMSLGIPDPQDRADLIAWLMQVSVDAAAP